MHDVNVVVTIDENGRIDRQIPWGREGGLARLASGTYAIERRSLGDGGHCYAVLERADGSAKRRLSERQVEVLALSARGLSGKVAAATTGISQSHFSRELAEVASKVGCTNRTELIWLTSVLAKGDEEPRSGSAAALSPAERHVLKLAQRGLSNAAIARVRSSSERTVANQVSRILVKTGLPTRRALATLAGCDEQQ
jgi:DNA-binding NarL/FixJ family response regulator